VTLILFSASAPHPLAEELSRQGHHIYEALAVSEVLALTDQHPSATIIVAADVDHERSKLIQQHHPTLHLKPAATTKDILWELASLSKTTPIVN
jgi:hypothetical protein